MTTSTQKIRGFASSTFVGAQWLRSSAALPAAGFVVILVVYGATSSTSFLNPFNISNVLIQVTPLVLIAVGQSFAVGTGGLDLSIGSTASLVAVVFATLFVPLGFPLALLVALMAAIVVGALNGSLIALGMEPFLVTLASLAGVQGIALLIQPVAGGEVKTWYTGVAGLWGEIPVALPFVLLAVLAASLLVRSTKTGASILAVGGDAQVARLVGIDVKRTLIKAYVLSALFAALAGLFLVARTRTGNPTIGAPFALDSLAAVVVGGTLLTGGRITMLGTVLGAFALGLLPNVMNLSGVSTFYQTATKGVILSLAILLPVIVSRALLRRRRSILARSYSEAI